MAQRMGRRPTPLESRLLPHLVITEPPATHDVLGRPLVGPCLIWTHHRHRGYGRIQERGKSRIVSRVMYELFVGPIKDQMDHLCRVPACASPAHLEDVTSAENNRRRPLSPMAGKKHDCPHGETNIFFERRSDGGLARRCRTCKREREHSRRLYHKSTRSPHGTGSGSNQTDSTPGAEVPGLINSLATTSRSTIASA